MDPSAMQRESQTIWNENAAFWDRFTCEGTAWHRHLIDPAVDRLLAVQAGERVLDVACGNGSFARQTACEGAIVTACGFSDVVLEHARARTREHAEWITYRLLDATNLTDLASLGNQVFDAVYCGLALHDLVTIDPLLTALRFLLKPTGRFVFSVLHPCSNASGVTLMMEEHDHEGERSTAYAVRVSTYLGHTPRKGRGFRGQPTPQYYFDRALSILFGACFRGGLALTGAGGSGV
jgi:2-polyprenyl-3-methyl-5-hydroxy-6-metoxy-1,4-benzoquinol methylase